jgi:hypothetical protein
MDAPTTHYARSGDFDIAYQVLGDGPVDLVFVPGWITHLDLQWEEPSLARFLTRLASFARLIVFDKRGIGLSDRVSADRMPTMEERMDDVRAVLDVVGAERAAVFCQGSARRSASSSPPRIPNAWHRSCCTSRPRAERSAPTTTDSAAAARSTRRGWTRARTGGATSSLGGGCCGSRPPPPAIPRLWHGPHGCSARRRARRPGAASR